MATRKSVRDALLGQKVEFRKEIVEFNGTKVEIRQPSYRERKEIMSRSKSGEGIDTFEFLIWSIIENTYLEGTNEKVFEDTDYDILMGKPAGGFIDKFGEVAANLMNVEEDVGEKAKN